MWTVSTMSSSQRGRDRTRYRHGDLRAALIEEGLQLARQGGPAAVVVREVTRRAGVAVNASYRHFPDRQALVLAVSLRAQGVVAAVMDQEVAAVLEGIQQASPATRARLELDAIGRAYVHFAVREPGLFETAFTVHADLGLAQAGNPDDTGPFGRLTAALDRCVAAGVIADDRRPGAELAAWSAVHGLAGLLLNGPLWLREEGQREAVINRVLRMVREGL